MSRKIPLGRNATKSRPYAEKCMEERSERLRKYFQEAISIAKRHQKRVIAGLGDPPVKTLYQNPFFKDDSGSIENFVFFEKANEKPVQRPKKPIPKDPTTTTTYRCQYKGCGKILALTSIGNRCKICNLEFCSLHRNPNYHESKCGDIIRGMLLIRAKKAIQKSNGDKEKKKHETEVEPKGAELRKKVMENRKYLISREKEQTKERPMI